MVSGYFIPLRLNCWLHGRRSNIGRKKHYRKRRHYINQVVTKLKKKAKKIRLYPCLLTLYPRSSKINHDPVAYAWSISVLYFSRIPLRFSFCALVTSCWSFEKISQYKSMFFSFLIEWSKTYILWCPFFIRHYNTLDQFNASKTTFPTRWDEFL